MDIFTLGSFVAIQDEANVVPGAAKPKALLALLALKSEHCASMETIIDELWEGNPPKSAVITVHSYILQLRKLIGNALRSPWEDNPRIDPKHFIVRESSGYTLRRFSGTYDVADYDRLTRAGQQALARNDVQTARRLLIEAQHLWRGSPFAGVRAGPKISAEATRLTESHNTLLERRIELDLRLGRHHEVLGELAGLTRTQPANEGLRGHYVVALYRSGQRTRALAECDRLRMHLAKEFGLDPSPTMRALRQAILVDERTPELPSHLKLSRTKSSRP